MVIDSFPRRGIHVEVDANLYKELQLILFRNGITTQHFFSSIVEYMVTGNSTMRELFEGMTKNTLSKRHQDNQTFEELNLGEGALRNTDAIYNFIEKSIAKELKSSTNDDLSSENKE